MWMYKGEERNGMDRWCYLIFLALLLFDTITSEVTGTRQYWCITTLPFFNSPSVCPRAHFHSFSELSVSVIGPVVLHARTR